jgi:hypothetical protein
MLADVWTIFLVEIQRTTRLQPVLQTVNLKVAVHSVHFMVM